MSEINTSTVRTRALGDSIRIIMECADISGKSLAKLLKWSESKVSRILTGQLAPSEVELASILALCKVTGEKYEQLMHLARAKDNERWNTPRNGLARELRRVIRVGELKESLVPMLLQTPDYARSVAIRMINVPFDQVEPWVTKVEYAQAIFEAKQSPHCSFFIHELALHLPIGNNEVMHAQLHHLMRMAVRKFISIRIIPTAVGSYPGLGYPFCLLDFPDGVMSAIYEEDEIAGHFTEDAELVDSTKKVLAGLAAIAYDEASSRKLIERIAVDLYDTPEEHDDDVSDSNDQTEIDKK